MPGCKEYLAANSLLAGCAMFIGKDTFLNTKTFSTVTAGVLSLLKTRILAGFIGLWMFHSLQTINRLYLIVRV